MPPGRIPAATYRLQLNRDFPLSRARELVPYLDALGVTDIYASPLLAARQGSPHGYDVTDPTRLNPELGGEEGLRSLAAALQERGMGLLLDIVPNHMAASHENPWWVDFLRWGARSPFAGFFDLAWQPSKPSLAGKVILPILGRQYAEALERGEITLSLTPGGFGVAYYRWWFPLNPPSHGRVLAYGLERLEAPAAAAERLAELSRAFSRTPSREEFAGACGDLWELYRQDGAVRAFLDGLLALANGHGGRPPDAAFLHEILEQQHYRLAFWRLAAEEASYRRFFDVAELVALRMEEPEVFEATHALVLALVRKGVVTGLRIDHIDGLRDPLGYLARLQEHLAAAGGGVYVVVEKILGVDEDLPPAWPVHGTTGYDFLNLLNALFVDGEGLAALDELYRQVSGRESTLEEETYAGKKKVMGALFRGEVYALARLLDAAAARDPDGRDVALRELEEAIVELTACLPVYRTYLREEAVGERERRYIALAAERVLARRPDLQRAVLLLKKALLLETPDRRAALEFALRWQQFTGPVMAKGFEDTALYTFNRLLSLNEVGAGQDAREVTPEEFHRHNRERLARRPHSLLATSTHDTKRSEDVRARLNVLAEIPHLFSAHLEFWREVNRAKKPHVGGRAVPGGNMEFFLYQTLLGAWPLANEEEEDFRGRLKGYLIKAAREAKEETSWLAPDPAYEEALLEFAEAILAPEEGNLFLKDFLGFQKKIAFYGALGSLAQVLLKIASPGVPDFYQGCEMWDFSLVDPDNRRPVDFARRAGCLRELEEKERACGPAALAAELLDGWADGRIKLYLTCKALRFRRAHLDLFAGGAYIPLEAAGPLYRHVCAFARRRGSRWALVAVPRLVARLALRHAPPRMELPLVAPLGQGVWGDTALVLPGGAPCAWRNVFTGEEVQAGEGNVLPLAVAFKGFPVALLEGES
ncbi:malto-oligosyltrehalose synthase [Desulfovirgula thermocuniculi]|uniref:malto-oligosyltrehalose synthase n=1 Tax=Desulfovirgula thermocuniculi TaxID=348842 RepID=UPI000400E4A2|nr:malto-oligosyltrehalose synthase [Desulfovirgula thermocuniculi]